MPLRRPFFISVKIKAFRVTQNETHKWQIMSVSTNKLSRLFAEHTCHNKIFYWVIYQNSMKSKIARKIPKVQKSKIVRQRQKNRGRQKFAQDNNQTFKICLRQKNQD